MKNIIGFVSLVSMTVLFTGCPNNTGTSGVGAGDLSSGKFGTNSGSKPSTTTKSTNGPSFTLVTATTADPNPPSGGSTTDSSAVPNFTIYFNATNTQYSLTDVCQVDTTNNNSNSGSNSDSGAKACKCQFSWDEINVSNSTKVSRTVETALTQVTSFAVQCPAPDVYNTEIPDNTILKIKVVPDFGKGNQTGFTTTNVLNFTKTSSSSGADFRDSEGRAYRNVFHYSCYDKPTKQTKIQHTFKNAVQNPVTQENIPAFVANSFAITDSANASGQSYYFDFYVRSNETGTPNQGTVAFTCPQVNINGVPNYFPMDSQFALGLQASKDFPIQVVGRTVALLGGGNDPGVLGYAAKPNPDGSCPAFTDSNGKIRRTFRLRQYSAIYPIRYKVDGDVLDKSQRLNTIFIMDRPVDKLGQDPLKPITRLGPKPCPFSFKTAKFGYKCSTDASLGGWDIDGAQIDGNPSCPIYPPVDDKYLKSDGTLVIRPYRPFAPHYIENQQFKACAFQSSTPTDPEIVLSHDDTVYNPVTGPNDFYCAKYYPPAGAIIDGFSKAPGDCDVAASAAAIKVDKTFSCSRAYNPTNSTKNTPAAGCCQICSGPNCTAQGGGTSAAGRNAAFSPPSNFGNPPQAIKLLPRAVPNLTGGGGCFDPYED